MDGNINISIKNFRWAITTGAIVLFVVVGDISIGQIHPDTIKTPVNVSIERGVKFIFHQQNGDGTWTNSNYRLADGGTDALGLLAVILSGDNSNDIALETGLQQLEKLNPQRTFARAMRVRVFASFIRMNRTKTPSAGEYTDSPYRKSPTSRYSGIIEKDVEWLIKAQTADGGWGLTGISEKNDLIIPNTTDTSNSIVALRQVQLLGIKIPEEVWTSAGSFLRSVQNSDGGFGYYPPNKKTLPVRIRGTSHGLTTAQGVLGLEALVSHNHDISDSGIGDTDITKISKSGLTPNIVTLKRGLAWLQKHQKIDTIPEWYWGDEPLFEYLLALSTASATAGKMGFKQPIKIKSVSDFLVEKQKSDGSWEGNPLAENQTASTARGIMTLCIIRKTAPLIPLKTKTTPTPPSYPENRGVDFIPGLKIARLVSADDDAKSAQLIPKLSKSLQAAYSAAIYEVTVSPGNKIPNSVSMAWLTCKNYSDLLRLQTRSIRNYLDAGGMLLVDSSSTERNLFWESRRVLSKLYTGGMLVKLTDDEPLINGNFSGGIGNNISKVTYINVGDTGVEKIRAELVLWGLKYNGRIVAIISGGSLSGAIGGQTTSGYTSQAGQRIVLNALLYANSIKPKPSESTGWPTTQNPFGK